MKLQPESKKELLRIACGVSLCTAVMWVVFAALHLVGWVVFDYRVLLGGIIGALVAIGNFAGICFVVQKVIDEPDEKKRKMISSIFWQIRFTWMPIGCSVTVRKTLLLGKTTPLPQKLRLPLRLLVLSELQTLQKGELHR